MHFFFSLPASRRKANRGPKCHCSLSFLDGLTPKPGLVQLIRGREVYHSTPLCGLCVPVCFTRLLTIASYFAGESSWMRAQWPSLCPPATSSTWCLCSCLETPVIQQPRALFSDSNKGCAGNPFSVCIFPKIKLKVKVQLFFVRFRLDFGGEAEQFLVGRSALRFIWVQSAPACQKAQRK